MSQSASNTDPGATSPETQFPLPFGRSDSPFSIDYNTNHTPNDILHRPSQVPQNTDGNHQHQISESAFAQGGGHPVYNSNINFHLSDYLSESEHLSLKVPPHGTKSPGDFGAGPFRSSFSAYNGINGAHTPHSSSGNPLPSSFRVRQVNTSSAASQSFTGASESFTNHPLGIQHQLSQQSQQASSMSSGFESRGIDFGSSPPLAGKISQQFALDPFLQSHAAKTQIHDSFHPLSHSNSVGQVPYLNGMHIQSQTPYGPHLQSSGGVSGAAVGSARGLGTSTQLNAATEPQGGNSQQEEISTIFVVGFPDDMQEREFQNMFTFSSGFEAATLKIPNKEYTAYGSSGGTPSGLPLRGSSSYSSYFNSGPNDPYNIVTVNQGGVVVDNGRDGPTTSWPPLPVPLDEPNHFQGPGSQPPRKQIIGFAKFRTRQEALEARDMLQGRRVDIEKGAVLKAEMAKKNLHTKRGVGIGSNSSGGGSISLGNNLNALAGLNGGMGGLSALGSLGVTPDTLAGLAAGINLNSTVNMNALTSLSGGDSLIARERELNALSAVGYNNLSSGWREGRLGDSSEEERERDRDRDRERRREALVGLNLGIGISGRGARERVLADEEERERLRRKDFKAVQGEAVRMLSGNSAVYDAFHPTPSLSRSVQTTILSPSGADAASSGPNSMLGNGFGGIIAQTPGRDDGGPREAVGPWDQPSPRERDSAYSALTSLYGNRKATVVPSPASPRDTSPPKSSVPFSPSLNDEDGMLPPHRSGVLRSAQAFTSAADEPAVSRPSAPPSSTTSSTSGLDDSGPVPLTVSTSGQVSTGNTSPQLPSPASHASSANSSSVGGQAASSSSGGVPNTVGSVGPRNALVDQNPPINTLYVGNLPTSPVGAGYPANYLEDSLRDLFSRRPGYRKLCFRQKSNGPMCFVEFEDVHYATKALNELYGSSLGGLVKNGGIRLSYSKNPLGVRTPTTMGTGTPLQQNSIHSSVASPFQVDAFQFRQGFDSDSGVMNIRRDNSNATSPPPPAFGYARSPPPPRFVSPPPSGSFNMVSSPTNGTTLPRGPHAYGISLSGTGGGFSPFGLPLSSPPDQSSTLPPSHSMIPDHPSSDLPSAHGHTQHFPHRALSPSSTVEAARAG
ncbi:hypothetical protein L210DRAFT_842558 [Boletus edulis BED1]|uniref:RRM domain-containing protein n=1 Tax=Boletus edulis BED1 TaxID=1328754 RepID=A0AAD4C841_BOLED|nr:hypothetical protein L210DRAFT_842558 [Boletus edulis BED1]